MKSPASFSSAVSLQSLTNKKAPTIVFVLLHPPPSSTPAASQVCGVQYVSPQPAGVCVDLLRPSSCQGSNTMAQAVSPLIKEINQEGVAADPWLPLASRLPDTADAAAQTCRASE